MLNRGQSISAMNETTASKLRSVNIARSVYEVRPYSIPSGSRRSSSCASAIMREVDAGHAGAATGEDAGVVSFAAPGVAHAPAVQVADEGEERRIVEPFAGDVGPAANLLGPRGGVSVPVARHVLDGEIVAHAPT